MLAVTIHMLFFSIHELYNKNKSINYRGDRLYGNSVLLL